MSERVSVNFDQAAEYYDATRGSTSEHDRETTEMLAGELHARGRILEVGVGTGQVAIPLHETGVPMAGIDLSAGMLAKLLQKCDGVAPFPLVRGDATRMPLADDAFGGAVLRWVLHLIPDWESVVRELVRVVRPGGVLLVNLGSLRGPWEDIRQRFAAEAGVSADPAGISWGDYDLLGAVLASLGGTARPLPPLRVENDEPLGDFIDGIERNRYSWTWPVPDDTLHRAAPKVRGWAEERFGPLDEVYPFVFEVQWYAYDLANRPR
jgi:SAM-dependent methyltransferase